ncbi:MAG: monovalent cation/H+ antiporter subunit D family protein [Candidatus Hydrogenedentes bacterium]|nr:monovalent cation/H+ antiporter subunit D family protein [Candidatus Hydrogenedentota bacterium]
MLLVLTIASSLLGGAAIFLLGEHRGRSRTFTNLALAVFKVAIILVMLVGAARGETYELRVSLLPGLDFVLEADALAFLFATLSAVLWFLTTIYAIGYLEHSPGRARFFGFFAWCVCATTGVAFAGNLFTFLVFYEMLTLATYPLVVHRGTEKAIQAGKIYLAYTFIAGAVLLLAIIWLRSIVGPVEFHEGGVLNDYVDSHRLELQLIFALLIAGFGVKAALFPLHGWLPQAMVAPAPVSALLHAVAVVKAGGFGIVRTVYDVYGISTANTLGLLAPLSIIASFTIIYGSARAVTQDDLKRRLAFSTVSQVSYIALGASIFGPVATVGGIVHIVHQALMKITLFFAAGNFAETLHIHKVSEMAGVGRRMPWTMTAFTVAALGMIGMPPFAGFVTKWYLAQGALSAGQDWVILVLITSAILNAAYFLPILYTAWFEKPLAHASHEDRGAHRFECPLSLLAPPCITAALAIAAGLFAGMEWSPLDWANFVMELEYE